MDLLPAVRTVWRYRLVAIAVLLLTGAGAGYLLVAQQPTYEAAASFVLINPPGPPSDAEIKANPALARTRADNPYTRFDNPWVIVEVLAQAATTNAARAGLVRAGADERYRVAPGTKFGFMSPVVQITGVGPTAAAAVGTARLVSKAVTAELYRMQRAQGVHDRYLIKPLWLEEPAEAALRPSKQLRNLAAVLALGGVLLFAVPAVLDAIRRWSLEASREAVARRTPR